MIRSFEISNFKSFRRAQLPLASLTLLVGANASGKSNAIEAIQLLSWMASGRRLGDLTHAIGQGEIAIRGGVRDWAGESQGDRDIGLDLSITGRQDEVLDLHLALRAANEGLRIVEEKLGSSEDNLPLYEVVAPAHPPSSDISVEYNNFARGGRKPRITCVDQQPVFTQLLTPARFGAQHTHSQTWIPRHSRNVRDVLSSILFLDPSPRQMRGYSFLGDHHLKGDGSNLSATLHHLCQEPEGEDRVLTFVKALPEQDIAGVSFLETPRNEVMVTLSETFGGQRTPREAALLSDGTLRVLSVAAALLSVPEGSMVVIEEIDNGVHPSRAERLLRHILDVAERRRLRVLLTTHNPALLDALPATSIPHVVVAYRDPKDGSSRLMRLEEVPRYPELLARGSLGSLAVGGWLDKYVKMPKTDPHQTESTHAWRVKLQRSVEGV